MEYLYCKVRYGEAPLRLALIAIVYHVSWNAVFAGVCDQCGGLLFEVSEVDAIQAALVALNREAGALTS